MNDSYFKSLGFGGDEDEQQNETDYDDSDYADYEEEFEPSSGPARTARVLSEVEERLAKANCYRALLESKLFADGDELARMVEEEVREFVRDRLSYLMGMKTPVEPVAVASQFTEEEVQVLKTLAAKVMARPASPTIQPVELKKQEVSSKAPTVVPTVLAVPSSEKRGPGRPKGSKNRPKPAAPKASQPKGDAAETKNETKKPSSDPKRNGMKPKNKNRQVSIPGAGLPMPSQTAQNNLYAQSAAMNMAVHSSGPEDGSVLLGGLVAQSLTN